MAEKHPAPAGNSGTLEAARPRTVFRRESAVASSPGLRNRRAERWRRAKDHEDGLSLHETRHGPDCTAAISDRTSGREPEWKRGTIPPPAAPGEPERTRPINAESIGQDLFQFPGS